MTSPDPAQVEIASGGPFTDTLLLLFDDTNWDLPVTVSVHAVDDALDNGNRTIDLALAFDGLTTTDAEFAALQPFAPLTVTLLDDDTVGIGVAPADPTVAEDGHVIINIALNTVGGNLVQGTLHGALVAIGDKRGRFATIKADLDGARCHGGNIGGSRRGEYNLLLFLGG